MWGVPRERSAVDRMAAIGRGEEDPGQWIEAPPEEVLVKSMADEICKEIMAGRPPDPPPV